MCVQNLTTTTNSLSWSGLKGPWQAEEFACRAATKSNRGRRWLSRKRVARATVDIFPTGETRQRSLSRRILDALFRRCGRGLWYECVACSDLREEIVADRLRWTRKSACPSGFHSYSFSSRKKEKGSREKKDAAMKEWLWRFSG